MTFSKIFLTSAMMFTASCAMANKAETTAYSNAGEYQKPGASINYSHNLKSQLSPGEVATFKLTLSESYTQGQLMVNLGTDGALALFPASTQASFDMSTATDHQMDVSFAVNANGRYYINVQAEAVDSSGQSQPRIFSIPVQVGPPTTQKLNPNMKTMDDGQNVIEMEAEEEIIFK